MECTYTKDDKEYLFNTLKNYYYLKRKEQELNQEILELDAKLEIERNTVKAYNYENSTAVAGSGCSVSCLKSLPVDYCTAKQVEKSIELDKIIMQYKSLDSTNKIVEKFYKLSPESQIIINNIFERGLTLENVAKIEKVSKTTISNRLDKALTEMLKV